MRPILLAAVFVLSLSCLAGQTSGAAVVCNSPFDLFLILDSSATMGLENKWTYAMNFTRGLVQRFNNPQTTFTFARFNDVGDLVMPRTRASDVKRIQQGLSDFAKRTPTGSTNIGAGIDKAIGELRVAADINLAMFFVVSDGIENLGHYSAESAEDARKLGALMFVVAPGKDIDIDVITLIANKPTESFVFKAPGGYEEMATDKFVEKITQDSCFSAQVMDPAGFCVGTGMAGVGKNATKTRVYVNGFGFNSSLAGYNCLVAGRVSRAVVQSPTRLYCDFDGWNVTGRFPFQIEMIGRVITRSALVLVVSDCAAVKGGLSGAAVFFIVLFILLPLLWLLWFFWPWLLGKKRPVTSTFMASEVNTTTVTETGGAPIAVPPPPPAAAKGKWAQVDTSKYIWATEGGTAKPLPVQWGELGPTQAAAHLEATTMKDGLTPDKENVYSQMSDSGMAAPPTGSETSCWDSFVAAMRSCWRATMEGCTRMWKWCEARRPYRE